ncbi:cysteine rich repeat-containing protein [Rhodomicrobium lacus]|uniref:cysteine rich repeat-containing protein n=1 Tax=Rhodomicrobium lacus TaxID=2498452 RepID=UPI0026E39F3F|nr:cysteine rich repeat-containing protein [Rhodomicrobium lacus]WKW50768.1 cysteine rich repeat-containing protein [Rhodomicrobium lacus]
MAVATLAAVLIAGQAQAGTDLKQVCAADYFKFCSDVTPGGGRIIACLKSHEKELQPACAAGIRDIDPAKVGEQKR